MPGEELEKLLVDIIRQMIDLGFEISEIVDSPITGEAGNHEFFDQVNVK